MSPSSSVLIDSRLKVLMPEGAELSLSPASFWVRSIAYLIDFLIRGVIYLALLFLLSRMGFTSGLMAISFFLLEWFFPIYFEVWRGGQTWGKQAMNLKVIHDDGTPIGFSASLIRNLLRVIDALPIGYAVAMVTMLCNREFKRLGDLAAGTLVVHVPQLTKVLDWPDVGSCDLPSGFNTDEQRMLLAFAQRTPLMSESRADELADIIKPLIPVPNTRVAILQMARSILGFSKRSVPLTQGPRA